MKIFIRYSSEFIKFYVKNIHLVFQLFRISSDIFKKSKLIELWTKKMQRHVT